MRNETRSSPSRPAGFLNESRFLTATKWTPLNKRYDARLLSSDLIDFLPKRRSTGNVGEIYLFDSCQIIHFIYLYILQTAKFNFFFLF